MIKIDYGGASRMNIIFLGAPGAGKGTQAAIISNKLGLPTISTGNIIRGALKDGTEMGKKAKEFVNKGQLVPDEVVIGIVKDRIQKPDCAKGFILDGFPRTISQAEALDNMNVKIDKVIDIEVSDQLIYDRMSGRRVCLKCGATYNINTDCKPKSDGICDKCGDNLVQREDDNPDTIKERLKVYYEKAEPLKEFYKRQGKLAVVNGQKNLNEATSEIINIIEA